MLKSKGAQIPKIGARMNFICRNKYEDAYPDCPGPKGNDGLHGPQGDISPAGPQGLPGIQGKQGVPGIHPPPSFIRIFCTLGAQTCVNTDHESVTFDNMGDSHGSDIYFTSPSENVTLAANKAYLAIFEGAFDFLGRPGSSGVAASFPGTDIHYGFGHQPSSVYRPSGDDSTLSLRFGETDNTHLSGPVLNIIALGSI